MITETYPSDVVSADVSTIGELLTFIFFDTSVPGRIACSQTLKVKLFADTGASCTPVLDDYIYIYTIPVARTDVVNAPDNPIYMAYSTCVYKNKLIATKARILSESWYNMYMTTEMSELLVSNADNFKLEE